jgi:hypothetical protein
MRALSIRQPYAELILRGIKRIEYRTLNTTLIGKRFYIYASKKKMPVASERWAENAAQRMWSDDLAVTTPRRGEHPPAWMLELAEELILGKLPTGVIVGSAVIESVTLPDPADAGALFRWHLIDVKRATRFRKPRGHPQPVWFKPF